MSATRRRAPSNGTGPRGRVKRPSLFDIQPGKYKPKLVRNGAIFAVFAAIFLYVIYTKPSIPLISGGGTTVKADFAYGADVVPGRTPVRVDGVDVGFVTGLSRTPSGRGARLTMTLNQGSGVKVTQNASASLREKTLLGLNYYVDLVPGSSSAAGLGDRVIPESRTSSQVELDQALEPLNATGRLAVQTMVDQFDAGFSDPSAVRRTIDATSGAMRSLATGLPGLRGTVPGRDLPALVSSTGQWMGAAARNEVALGGLIDNGSTALGVTAAQQLDLGSTFDQAPAALSQTEATMARLRATIATLNPVAQALEPGARKLGEAATLARTALNAATPVLADLKPTLAAIRPSVNALSKASKAGVPVINSLTPTFNRVQSSFIPFLNRIDPETKLKNYEAVGPTVASVDSATAWGDQYGGLADFEAGFGENTVGGLAGCSSFLTNPTATQLLDCTALEQLLRNILTGQSLTTPLAKTPSLANKVTALLKGRKP